MTPHPSPANEAARLAALRRYGVLDTPPEAEFDDITRLAAGLCEAPVALICLVDGQRLWCKSATGLDRREMPLEDPAARELLLQPGLLEVPDVRLEARFKDHPLVTGAPPLRFYAGAALLSGEGLPLGTLCVLDTRPRSLTEVQKEALNVLARQVMTALELRLSRTRLHRMIESISEALLTLDHDFCLTYGNSHADRLLQRTLSEYLGRPVWEMCEEGETSPFTAQFRRAAKEGRLVVFEAFYKRTGLWLEVRVYPSPEGMTVNFQDVTARRNKEEHLRLLETSVMHLQDIVIITEAAPIDLPGPRIVYVNDAFVRRTGYAREEAVGKTPRLLQGPRTQRAALDRIRAALLKGEPAREELINYTKTGEELWLELEIMPVTDDSGACTHFVSIEREISERKRTEARLERLYAVSSGINEAIVRVRDVQELYQQACHIAVNLGGLVMAWVGLVDAADAAIIPTARAGRNEGYL